MKKASDVNFGIEIECNIPRIYSSTFPVGGYHRGMQVNLDNFEGWNTQSDASVRAYGETYPAEIVSPKLRGEGGLIKVVEMLDFLDQIGARTNQSCGLHIHVGIEDLSPVQVARIPKLFKAFEKAFYALNGTQAEARYNSGYCYPSNRWAGGHYDSLNLTHVSQGHIEIRVWSGTLKPETVVAAIYMAVSLVSRASLEDTIKTSDLRTNNKSTQVMASYIKQFVKGDTMIIPDADPEDLMFEMITKSMVAKLQ